MVIGMVAIVIITVLCSWLMFLWVNPIPIHLTSSIPKGYDSTFAKSQKSGVMNNEMIVYDVNQANLRYFRIF